MLQLTCPTCQTKHEPNELVFDDEWRVTNNDDLGSLAEQVGLDRFRVPVGLDSEHFLWLSHEDFKRFLTDHTDLLVEHAPEHWDNLPNFKPT